MTTLLTIAIALQVILLVISLAQGASVREVRRRVAKLESRRSVKQ